jgi:upstream-binding transcription factor
MPTVTISAAVDKMMKNMFSETMEACVAKLSEKYGFDEKEALEFLEIDGLKENKEEKKKQKKEKKEKKEVDPNKPKKTSGYLLYSADVREQVKANLIEDGGEGKPNDVVQAIAAKWKELTDEEKAVWNGKAKATKDPVDAN